MWTFEVDPGVAVAIGLQACIYLLIVVWALIDRK
jgi:hypothetical protein